MRFYVFHKLHYLFTDNAHESKKFVFFSSVFGVNLVKKTIPTYDQCEMVKMTPGKQQDYLNDERESIIGQSGHEISECIR